jgi:hypothetical protein
MGAGGTIIGVKNIPTRIAGQNRYSMPRICADPGLFPHLYQMIVESYV